MLEVVFKVIVIGSLGVGSILAGEVWYLMMLLMLYAVALVSLRSLFILMKL